MLSNKEQIKDLKENINNYVSILNENLTNIQALGVRINCIQKDKFYEVENEKKNMSCSILEVKMSISI